MIVDNKHGIIFKDNVVRNASGTKGFLYTSIDKENFNVTLIQNNTFTNVAGYYGSAVIHVGIF